jgi:O-acetyl-ADP-ribose deacetylase (regulator of RNase III)
MELHVAQADIATLPVDAVVVPADSMGSMDLPASQGICERAGETVIQEYKAHAPIAVGAAVMTSGGELSSKHVIHVPVVKHSGEQIAAEHLRRAVRAALIAANMNQLSTVAFPSMSSGQEGPTVAEAARAVVQELVAHRKSFPETIYLVAPEEETIGIFEEAIHNAQRGL